MYASLLVLMLSTVGLHLPGYVCRSVVERA